MRRLAYLALPLAAFCTGLAAGAWFFSGRQPAGFAADGRRSLVENAAATPAPSAETARAFSSDEEMLTALMSAVADDEPLRRAHRLYELLGRLHTAELAVLFDRAVRVDDRDRRGVLLRALLRRWAAADAAGATAAVRPYRERFRAAGPGSGRGVDQAVNEAWAQAQPNAALAEAMTAPNAPWARNSAWAAFETLADGDRRRQLDALGHLPVSSLRASLCESAITALAAADSAAAESFLGLLTEPRERTRVQTEILAKLAERDAPAALARFAALAPGLTPGIASTMLAAKVLSAAAKQDGAAALAAAEGLPEELRGQAYGAALVGWADKDPVAALEWAVAHGVDVGEAKAMQQFDDDRTMYNPLLNAAFHSDREKTLAWVRAQPRSSERDTMLNAGIWSDTAEQKIEIFNEITPAGQATAAAEMVGSSFNNGTGNMEPWVKTLPAGAARRTAIQVLASHQASNAPESLDTLADAWPAGADRDAALTGLLWSVTQNDPRRALDFARRVGDPAARESALEWAADSWLYKDAAAARAWVSSAPELSAEQKCVLLRQHDSQ